MSYIKITERIAAENNITAEEVETEMKAALKEAGIEMDPDKFISLICSNIRRNITRPDMITLIKETL